MSFLDTNHKRKSAVLTTIIGIAILLLIFMFGMTYFDPPKEYGIAVNFGTTDFGSGNVQPKEALKPAQQEPEVAEEVVEEEVVEEEVVEQEQVEEVSAPVEDSAEDVITQNNAEALAIKKREDAKRKENEAKKREEDRIKKEAEAKVRREAEIERKKIEAEQKRVAEEKRKIEKDKQEKAAKRKKVDAMMGGISDGDGKATGGEGDDNKPGDKGKITGDPNSKGYYGNGGGGSGGNYRLGNRKALSKPKPTYDCNEEGKVVVSISVDKTGKVFAAQAGIKGTTNSASCLLERAKEAALKTRFNSDSNAPSKQTGIIIYDFSYN